ncbi:dipeptidase [Oceanobacillus caeni]|uniref:Diguanylate cyclase n=1 Tax=Oceanobacillus caeni TaxID=405946 RepID=A0ABR5MN42_9BACI|nr:MULTISPECIES: dipeptidase [Bacillaceae]KKE79749.1 diguanylate cyclase [Bacilli bacterium VT-13-104]PZD89538.1 membrane dipeptidase [Bacilli bacterium]KPH78423.1 diguanylate cyclase [Oceanobacillus caeni]MBU8789223.1 dipeptidase [Oceanobacillus caeni]MCR1832991.1 dipeptidase [Oceanobacillus caeni]
MKIIDTHCDALMKLQLGKRKQFGFDGPFDYKTSEKIETNLNRLIQGNVAVQFFAIFIEPDVPFDEKWQHALEQVDIFYTDVLGKNPKMKHIKNWSDLDLLKEGEIGAVLALEGADPFGNDLMKLRQLYRLGIMSVGLTWNYANYCADGVLEPRGAGLSLLGKEVIKLNNENHVFSDVSHASIQAFWDILEIADYPIATHSNAKAICNHPRNLDDDQIKEMFRKNGLIHVVFNPPFINKDKEVATITDLIRHIDYFCSLGGVNQIGFGSDFDGITSFVNHLENSSNYQNLINELLKNYSEEEVRGFAYKNFLSHRPGI